MNRGLLPPLFSGTAVSKFGFFPDATPNLIPAKSRSRSIHGFKFSAESRTNNDLRSWAPLCGSKSPSDDHPGKQTWKKGIYTDHLPFVNCKTCLRHMLGGNNRQRDFGKIAMPPVDPKMDWLDMLQLVDEHGEVKLLYPRETLLSGVAATEVVIGPFANEYAFLSNFFPASVVLRDVVYPTVEHAYQAAKSEDASFRRMIAGLSKPGEAKRRGRKQYFDDNGIVMRPEWEDIKLHVMYSLIRQKFTRHEHLRKKLLATGNTPLVEINWWGDTFYGVCNDLGENWLGRLLMELRDELRN